MIGAGHELDTFRVMFRRHISNLTESELAIIERRLEHLQDDIKLRKDYLTTITPLAIIRRQDP